MKKYVFSVLMAVALLFGISALPINGQWNSVCQAYQGETDDQFICRVFYGNWTSREDGGTYVWDKNTVAVDEIISCDVVKESAFLQFHFIKSGKIHYAYILKGNGMIVYADRNCKTLEGSLVHMF